MTEARFKKMLETAGLPAAECQKTIPLGPVGQTIPDFFYAGEDKDEPILCIFLDGISAHIHRNPQQAAKDKLLRDALRSKDYEIMEIRSFELDDRGAMIKYIGRTAKLLFGKEKQQAINSWFERAGP